MLSILFLSAEGEGYGLACKVAEEGHIAKFWSDANYTTLANSSRRPQQINQYDEHIEAADLVVLCSRGFAGAAESLRAAGKLVLGGGIQEILADEDNLSLVASWLQTSVATSYDPLSWRASGWFDGEQFVTGVVGYLSCRLLDGERGPITEGMGLVSKPQLQILDSLTPLLKEAEFRGFLSFEFSGHDWKLKQVFAGGTTFDHAATFELVNEPIGEFLYKVAKGQAKVKFATNLGSTVVRVADLDSTGQLTLDDKALKHFWLTTEDDTYGYASARGLDRREARRRVYRTITSIANVDCVYRTDIGTIPLWEESPNEQRHLSVSETECATPSAQIQEDGQDRELETQGPGEGAEASLGHSL